mmetsp:Transcript_942/g.3946  ORF Transcript_942/g.3946 Transcript_942/m.3946 type:complete len:404 (+) Transcript_942:6359-7570(+)
MLALPRRARCRRHVRRAWFQRVRSRIPCVDWHPCENLEDKAERRLHLHIVVRVDPWQNAVEDIHQVRRDDRLRVEDRLEDSREQGQHDGHLMGLGEIVSGECGENQRKRRRHHRPGADGGQMPQRAKSGRLHRMIMVEHGTMCKGNEHSQRRLEILDGDPLQVAVSNLPDGRLADAASGRAITEVRLPTPLVPDEFRQPGAQMIQDDTEARAPPARVAGKLRARQLREHLTHEQCPKPDAVVLLFFLLHGLPAVALPVSARAFSFALAFNCYWNRVGRLSEQTGRKKHLLWLLDPRPLPNEESEQVRTLEIDETEGVLAIGDAEERYPRLVVRSTGEAACRDGRGKLLPKRGCQVANQTWFVPAEVLGPHGRSLEKADAVKLPGRRAGALPPELQEPWYQIVP